MRVATKSATEILLEFTNNGTETAYLTLCRCHGIAVVESDPVKVWAEDDESKDQFGYLPYTNVGKFLTNIAEAQDRCDHFLAIYKDPVPIISFDLKANYDSAHLSEAQVRDVSDRITITAGAPYGLYIDEDFFVEWIRHSVGRDKLHVMTLLCSSVVSHHWPASGTPYEPKVIPPPTTGGSPHVSGRPVDERDLFGPAPCDRRRRGQMERGHRRSGDAGAALRGGLFRVKSLTSAPRQRAAR